MRKCGKRLCVCICVFIVDIDIDVDVDVDRPMGTSLITGIKLWKHKGKEWRPPLPFSGSARTWDTGNYPGDD